MMKSSQVIEAVTPAAGTAGEARPDAKPRSRPEIERWLTEYLAFLLDEKPEAVDVELSFDSHGIDSAAAVSLVADLEDWLGLELDPTIVYDYPNVSELAAYLDRRQVLGAA
jgi:acyl carrier protein